MGDLPIMGVCTYVCVYTYVHVCARMCVEMMNREQRCPPLPAPQGLRWEMEEERDA